MSRTLTYSNVEACPLVNPVTPQTDFGLLMPYNSTLKANLVAGLGSWNAQLNGKPEPCGEACAFSSASTTDYQKSINDCIYCTRTTKYNQAPGREAWWGCQTCMDVVAPLSYYLDREKLKAEAKADETSVATALENMESGFTVPTATETFEAISSGTLALAQEQFRERVLTSVTMSTGLTASHQPSSCTRAKRQEALCLGKKMKLRAVLPKDAKAQVLTDQTILIISIVGGAIGFIILMFALNKLRLARYAHQTKPASQAKQSTGYLSGLYYDASVPVMQNGPEVTPDST